MSGDTTKLDQQIERLRKGDTLAEIEVKALCEKVGYPTPAVYFVFRARCRVTAALHRRAKERFRDLKRTMSHRGNPASSLYQCLEGAGGAGYSQDLAIVTADVCLYIRLCCLSPSFLFCCQLL
jgi:hypothetical protein